MTVMELKLLLRHRLEAAGAGAGGGEGVEVEVGAEGGDEAADRAQIPPLSRMSHLHVPARAALSRRIPVSMSRNRMQPRQHKSYGSPVCRYLPHNSPGNSQHRGLHNQVRFAMALLAKQPVLSSQLACEHASATFMLQPCLIPIPLHVIAGELEVADNNAEPSSQPPAEQPAAAPQHELSGVSKQTAEKKQTAEPLAGPQQPHGEVVNGTQDMAAAAPDQAHVNSTREATHRVRIGMLPPRKLAAKEVVPAADSIAQHAEDSQQGPSQSIGGSQKPKVDIGPSTSQVQKVQDAEANRSTRDAPLVTGHTTSQTTPTKRQQLGLSSILQHQRSLAGTEHLASPSTLIMQEAAQGLMALCSAASTQEQTIVAAAAMDVPGRGPKGAQARAAVGAGVKQQQVHVQQQQQEQPQEQQPQPRKRGRPKKVQPGQAPPVAQSTAAQQPPGEGPALSLVTG
jgi:hypothetical protein